MAQKTDAQLTTEALVIKNETTAGANTANRLGEMYVDIIDSKVNTSRIDYKSFVAVLSHQYPNAQITQNQLYNDIGDGSQDGVHDISFTAYNGSTPYIDVLCTGLSPFIQDKVFVNISSAAGSGGDAMTFTVDWSSLSQMTIRCYQNPLSVYVTSFINLFIEIRIYN